MKEFILQVMQQKAKRIQKQRHAVEQYQHYLEKVRSKNQDQYATISAIMDRHKTLLDLQQKLRTELESKESELVNKRKDLALYESQQSTLSMQLNNEIAHLKKRSEMIDDQRNQLKSQVQENSSKQF